MADKQGRLAPSVKLQGGAVAVLVDLGIERLTDLDRWWGFAGAAVTLFVTYFVPELLPPRSAVE